MVFFWGNCSTSSFLSFFSPTVWVIPCRKWVRRWDCTLDWLPPRLKCLPSTHLHLNSPAVTYYRMRQMDSRDEEREKRLKAFSFLSKSARCQVRMERCRNCRHSDLNYNSRISATSGMEADMILFCVTFFFSFSFHLYRQLLLMCHCGCGFNSRVGYRFIYITLCVLEQGTISAVPLEEYGFVLMDRWRARRTRWIY